MNEFIYFIAGLIVGYASWWITLMVLKQNDYEEYKKQQDKDKK